MNHETEFKFGDYAIIEQKRHGVPSEMFVHKVIGIRRSNSWVDVPVQSPATETLHRGMEVVCLCICCGIDETKVRQYRVQDMRRSSRSPDSELTAALATIEKCREVSNCPAGVDLQDHLRQLAAENTYLLNGAARELNTSWMFHKTMLGAQAALVCLAHGYQAAAREWLEGTTDEAGAEIPDDISVGELHEWFDSQMVSNDGNSGFLTRVEAEEAIRKACPATDRIVAGIKAAIEYPKNNSSSKGWTIDPEFLGRVVERAGTFYGYHLGLEEAESALLAGLDLLREGAK